MLAWPGPTGGLSGIGTSDGEGGADFSAEGDRADAAGPRSRRPSACGVAATASEAVASPAEASAAPARPTFFALSPDGAFAASGASPAPRGHRSRRRSRYPGRHTMSIGRSRADGRRRNRLAGLRNVCRRLLLATASDGSVTGRPMATRAMRVRRARLEPHHRIGIRPGQRLRATGVRAEDRPQQGDPDEKHSAQGGVRREEHGHYPLNSTLVLPGCTSADSASASQLVSRTQPWLWLLSIRLGCGVP